MPTKLLIVEDDPDFRESFCEHLNREGFSADGVKSISAYKAWQSTHTCDILLLNRNLPDGDWLDILRTLQKTETMPVIILSGARQTEGRKAGISADADDHFAKPVNSGEMIAILKRLSRGLNDEVNIKTDFAAAWVLNTVDWRLSAPCGRDIALTQNELSLLTVFIDESGITIERDEIIHALGYDPKHYDTRRIEALVRRLRKKIESHEILQFPLATVYGVGYVFNAALQFAD
jgi:DNA-binding response OmpR family regulator